MGSKQSYETVFGEDPVERALRQSRVKRISFVEIAGVGISVVLAILGVIAAWIYYEQLQEMRHTNELTRQALSASDNTLQKTLAKMQSQVEAADHLYAEAQKQTEEAKKESKAAQETAKAEQDVVGQWKAQIDQQKALFQAEQRPYIWIKADEPLIEAGSRIMINVYKVNYGKSPAISEKSIDDVFFGPDALAQADRWFKDNDSRHIVELDGPGTIIPPGVPADKDSRIFSSSYSDEFLTKAQAEWVKEDDFSVAIVIRDQYFDTSGKRYWTDRCMTRFKNGLVADCATHNEIH